MYYFGEREAIEEAKSYMGYTCGCNFPIDAKSTEKCPDCNREVYRCKQHPDGIVCFHHGDCEAKLC